MSALATRRRPRAMIFVPGKGAFAGAVDVYRDGAGVVVVGAGTVAHQGRHGVVRAKAQVEVHFPNLAAYNDAKERAFLKNPERYAQLVGALGIDDDARHAPAWPGSARALAAAAGAGPRTPALAALPAAVRFEGRDAVADAYEIVGESGEAGDGTSDDVDVPCGLAALLGAG